MLCIKLLNEEVHSFGDQGSEIIGYEEKEPFLPWSYHVGLDNLHLICQRVLVCMSYLLQWRRESPELSSV
jgi:hypothetical protein